MKTTRSRFMLVRAGALCTGAALLVLAACEAKVPTAADIESMNVASAEKSALDAGLLAKPSVDFFVNGAKVKAEVARALQAKIIGSIEVVKSELPTGRDTIFVTTVDRMPKVRAAAAYDEAERAKFGSEARGNPQRMKTLSDSNERMVAHVERELAAVRKIESAGAPATSRQRVAVRTPAGTGGEPVFMIDGKKVSSAAFSAVREDDIAAISVYKGEQALRMSSDPAAKNGVIAVIRKMATKN